jgi:hypothetical protein
MLAGGEAGSFADDRNRRRSVFKTNLFRSSWPRRAANMTATVPRRQSPTTAPTHVLQTGPTSPGRPHFPRRSSQHDHHPTHTRSRWAQLGSPSNVTPVKYQANGRKR